MIGKVRDDADISVAGLCIWIHSWQFPDSQEYWDANWLNCTAECTASGAKVVASGSFLHLPELLSWLEQCETLYKTLSGNAVFEPMERTVCVKMTAQSLGHIGVEVELTPDNLTQKHWFKFEVDQTDLGHLASQLRRVAERFPARGKASAA